MERMEIMPGRETAGTRTGMAQETGGDDSVTRVYSSVDRSAVPRYSRFRCWCGDG